MAARADASASKPAAAFFGAAAAADTATDDTPPVDDTPTDTPADPARYEEGLELTYADRIGRFTIQPDIQLIRDPGGLKDVDDVVVVSLRVITPLF